MFGLYEFKPKKCALIGHTGFVGSNLKQQMFFTDYYNSKNIKDIHGKEYDEIYCCNGSNLPFKDGSVECIISNNVLIHVLQNSDKIKIFKEVKRVLSKNGIYLFSFTPLKGLWKKPPEYVCPVSVKDMQNLVSSGGLKINKMYPCYFMTPWRGSYPQFVNFSRKIVYPITDKILKKIGDLDKAQVNYCLTSKDSKK